MWVMSKKTYYLFKTLVIVISITFRYKSCHLSVKFENVVAFFATGCHIFLVRSRHHNSGDSLKYSPFLPLSIKPASHLTQTSIILCSHMHAMAQMASILHVAIN